MYKCLKSDFPALEKRIYAICKKLDKHNLHYVFEKFPDSVELIPHYAIDYATQTQLKTGSFPHEVANYNFEMESLKLGEWQPIAVIEHGVNAKTGGNMVFPLFENVIVNPLWATISSNCEHCNSNRNRSKTVILQDTNGNQKQVGTTCVKDFTGIDAADIISIYKDVSCIIENELSFTESSSDKGRNYTSTIDYLAHSINLINQSGYDKQTTKFKAFQASIDGNASETDKSKAQEIINFFSQFDSMEDMQNLFKTDVSFYWDIAQSLQNEYTKINGLIAYAPVAYTKAIEIVSKQKASEVLKKASQWYGAEGEKINLTLEYISSYSYESSFNGGYSSVTQFIHLFKDSTGNTFKWSTANSINAESGNTIQLKGTIKKHSEYKGEKQTELTRCKVL